MSSEVFYVSIPFDRRNIRLKIQQIYKSGQLERYRVSGKNGSIVLQSNRPLLRGKGIKYRRPNWKITEGGLHNTGFLERLISAVEDNIKLKGNNG